MEDNADVKSEYVDVMLGSDSSGDGVDCLVRLVGSAESEVCVACVVPLVRGYARDRGLDRARAAAVGSCWGNKVAGDLLYKYMQPIEAKLRCR